MPGAPPGSSRHNCPHAHHPRRTRPVLHQFVSQDENAGALPAGVVVWRIDRDKVNRGQVLKVIGSDIHEQLTVRNPNTARKLYAVMRADTISP
jgi:hypothetical protein